MRLHSSNFLELDPPIRERRILDEVLKNLVADGLNFGDNECSRFRDLRHQILDLPDSGEVFTIRAILGQLKGCEVIKTFEFQLERLFKFKTINKALGRRAEFALPFLQPRIGFLNPDKIFLPLPDVSKKTC